MEEAIRRVVDEKLQPINQVVHQSYSGPLPPASECERYERLHPGFIDRWITMAEKSRDGEEATIERRDKGALIYSLCSLGAAFILCLILIAGGIWLLREGQRWEGVAALGSAIASVWAAAFRSKKSSGRR